MILKFQKINYLKKIFYIFIHNNIMLELFTFNNVLIMPKKWTGNTYKRTGRNIWLGISLSNIHVDNDKVIEVLL